MAKHARQGSVPSPPGDRMVRIDNKVTMHELREFRYSPTMAAGATEDELPKEEYDGLKC